MNDKNLGVSYVSSPLRRKSLVASKVSRLSIVTNEFNDDEAELRRRRESSVITSTPVAKSNSRQSMGYSLLSHNQLQQKVLQCIQLNTENKINIKNAFSIPAIDILAYFVKTNQDPDLQVASSSLDVGAKVYSLRVDKVYLEVNKLCSNMGKDSEMMDETNNPDANDQEPDVNGEVKQQKKRKKRINVFSTPEALKGKIETINLDALMTGQDDPQTSDVLNQIQAVLNVKDSCFMNNFMAPVLDSLNNNNPKSYNNYTVTNLKSSLKPETIFSYSFLMINNEDELDDSNRSEEEMMEVDNNEPNVFHFDIDEIPDNTPFPTQDVMEVAAAQEKRHNEPQFIVDFHHSIARQTISKESEYTYMPHDLINFNGPSYWRIVKRSNVNVVNDWDRCKQIRKKKEVSLTFEQSEVEEMEKKFTTGTRIRCSEATLNSWNEEKHLINSAVPNEIDPLDLFKCATQEKRFIKVIRTVQEGQENHQVRENNDEHDFAAMNDEIIDGLPNGNDDSDDRITDNDLSGNNFSGTNMDQNNLDLDLGPLSQGVLTGQNLVDAPSVVENIYIPYSKRAKKIDVRQVKKSMIKLLSTKMNLADATLNGSINERDNENSTFEFGVLYKQLPQILSKANSEAMSVPIAFVSLLHLANEKSLRVNPTNNSDELIIMKDRNQ